VGYVAIVTIAGAFIAFALISRKIDDSMLTGPMLFAGLGLVVGPAALGTREENQWVAEEPFVDAPVA